MENKVQNKAQNVVLEDRKKCALSGVSEVVSAQDSCVVAKTVAGVVSICGNNLRVEKLTLDDGNLVVLGTINSIKYSGGETKNFFARLFK